MKNILISTLITLSSLTVLAQSHSSENGDCRPMKAHVCRITSATGVLLLPKSLQILNETEWIVLGTYGNMDEAQAEKDLEYYRKIGLCL